MPKQKIFIKQEVLIEWTTPEQRKEVLKYLKQNPNCLAIGSGYYRFTKTGKPITFIFPNKVKP